MYARTRDRDDGSGKRAAERGEIQIRMERELGREKKNVIWIEAAVLEDNETLQRRRYEGV